MKNIEITTVTKEVRKLLTEASFNLPDDIKDALVRAAGMETDAGAKKILGLILENAEIAREQKLPLCQDCGSVYIDIDIGPGICIGNGGSLSDSLNHAVAEIYQKNYLRKSIVSDPLYERNNTLDNTPAIISTNFTKVPGLHIKICLKGGGSENCSYLHMLNPSVNEDEVINVVLDIIKKNVTKCCPPAIIGVGLGGTSSEAACLARKASFRNLNIRNEDRRYRALEDKILKAVNQTGIGPQGLGGKTTALACNVAYAPCHIATLPMAVFIGCHSLRRAESKISPP